MVETQQGEGQPCKVHVQAKTGVSALQVELRRLFQAVPVHIGVQQSLARLGEYLEATYGAVHARLGSHFLSEEWSREGLKVGEELRDSTNRYMLEALESGKSRCLRLGVDPEFAAAVVVAVIYDKALETVGAAAMVVGPCDRERALEALSLFEGALGFISLLALQDPSGAKTGGFDVEHLDPQTARAAEHPTRLAYHMVSALQNRHGLDKVAVGFVNGTRVKVVAAGDMDEVRAANPGVKLIRGAMEECLDRDGIVLCHGTVVNEDASREDDCRMHAQWSKAVGGDTVGSFPIRFEKEVVAVVSVRHGSPLEIGDLARFAEELSGYETLVPLSNLSVRGVVAHARDSVVSWMRKKLESSKGKVLMLLLLPTLFVGWLAIGSLPYSLTVPCVVTALDQRTVSAPREGVLLEINARPGVRVVEGQLLAILDVREEKLRRVELEAELAKLEAQTDMALGEGNAGGVRVLEAGKNAVLAELEVVGLAIEQAEIRAPMSGIVIDGDLRRRVGSRVALGEPLFELATSDQLAIELHIPENRMSHELADVTGVFAPSARPYARIPLGPISVFPVSQVLNGENVFFAESMALTEPRELLPGMEGVAHLNVGWRRAWWVLTHRITDWMHLNFWL